MTEEEKRLQELETEKNQLKQSVDDLSAELTFQRKKFKRDRRARLHKAVQLFLFTLNKKNKKKKIAKNQTRGILKTKRYKKWTAIETILGMFTLVLGIFGTYLVIRQNEIAQNQADLMGMQNNMVQNQTALMDSQTNIMKFQNLLFDEQNKMVGKQTNMIDWQNRLFENQNGLVQNQNALIQHQSERLDQQTYLQEADRRSALIFLMGNIFDAVDRELSNETNKNKILSPQLIGRIIALSHSLTPYHFLEGGVLTEREYSPERGQLLLSLINSNISPISLDSIYLKSNFDKSYLKGAYLSDAYLKNIILNEANLEGADLQNANFEYAWLIDANLKDAKCIGANFHRAIFYKANLVRATFIYANLDEAKFDDATILDDLIFYFEPTQIIKFNNEYNLEVIGIDNLGKIGIDRQGKISSTMKGKLYKIKNKRNIHKYHFER